MFNVTSISSACFVVCLFPLGACSSSSTIDPEMPDASFGMDGGIADLDVGPGVPIDAGNDAGPPPQSDAGVDAEVFDAGPPAPTLMAACLEAGGSFRIVDTIDNNDTRDHGSILTFDVSAERQIVVSSADATLKFWTLDSFQGETGLAQLTYGPEIIATSVALDFWDELAVAGDSQGIIAGWSPTAGMQMVLGGTTPGTALVALAIDDEGGFLAQADADGTLLIRPLPGFEGETVQLEGVHAADLSWANGVLFIATPTGLEARDIHLDLIAEALMGTAQLHVHADGNVVVAGDGQLRAFDASLRTLGNDILSFVGLKSLTLVGGHPVGLFGGNGAGAVPYIEVQIAGTTGEQRNTMFIFDAHSDEPRVPVQVISDPQGELLFVAFEDGGIELLSCEN